MFMYCFIFSYSSIDSNTSHLKAVALSFNYVEHLALGISVMLC